MSSRSSVDRSGAGPRRDRAVLIAARTARGFGAGTLSIVLALDLPRAGYSSLWVGMILGLALGGGSAWALAVPWLERRWRRRSVLLVGALALAAGGTLLWLDLANPWAVLVALLLGGIVTGGSDVGPLGVLEQAALTGTVSSSGRTRAFVWYNLLGYAGNAAGALFAGPISSLPLAAPGAFAPGVHDVALALYGLLGLALVPVYRSLSSDIDRDGRRERPTALSPQSRPVVFALAGLFAVDAFGGGLILNSLVVYYFSVRFGPPVGELDAIFFAANLAAALSLVLADPLARRFGLINTMVFTHIPSNVLLTLVAFSPTLGIAAVFWVGRATLSQMDVPTRQSYTQAVVPREDRAAAAGYTTAARSGQAFGGPVTGVFLAAGGPWLGAPFVVAGLVKIGYDLAVYARFRRLRPPEEGFVPGPDPVRPGPPR